MLTGIALRHHVEAFIILVLHPAVISAERNY